MTKKPKNNSKQAEASITELLEQLDKSELIVFLADYADNNASFRNAVDVRFRQPQFEAELSKLGLDIDIALEEAIDSQSSRRWYSLDFDGTEIYAEITTRMEQGYTKLAFAALELLYRKLLGVFEYQGECEIADDVEYCLHLMSKTAGKADSTEDKEYIFTQCIELSKLEDGKDYGADYEDKLLIIAAKFVTSENLADLEGALACFDSGWREEEFKLIHLSATRKVKGRNAAEHFITENLRFPKIREIAFEKAVRRKDYTMAEQLCEDALLPNNHSSGTRSWTNFSTFVSPWLYKLYSVYEITEQEEKMTETAQRILFSGDIDYYDKVKMLLTSQAAWEASYHKLLGRCKEEFSYSQYMEILAIEGETVLLLEQIRQHPKSIFHFGKALAQAYPIEVTTLFTEQIGKEAENAYGRESYRQVCSRICTFSEAGYKAEAHKLIESMKVKFKGKPAFVDELGKVSGLVNPVISKS